jgi:hypothetical protein
MGARASRPHAGSAKNFCPGTGMPAIRRTWWRDYLSELCIAIRLGYQKTIAKSLVIATFDPTYFYTSKGWAVIMEKTLRKQASKQA